MFRLVFGIKVEEAGLFIIDFSGSSNSYGGLFKSILSFSYFYRRSVSSPCFFIRAAKHSNLLFKHTDESRLYVIFIFKYLSFLILFWL